MELSEWPHETPVPNLGWGGGSRFGDRAWHEAPSSGHTLISPFPFLVIVIYITYVLPFLGVQFNCIKYNHIVVQPSPSPISKIFSSSQTETLYPFTITLHPPGPQPLAPTILFSVSMNLTTPGTSYK